MSIISNHALLRYLERVSRLDMKTIKKRAAKMGYVVDRDVYMLAFMRDHMGIDVDGVRNRLSNSKEIQRALSMKAQAVRWNGIVFRLRDGIVVTTICPEELKRMRPNLRRNQRRALITNKRRLEMEYERPDV